MVGSGSCCGGSAVGGAGATGGFSGRPCGCWLTWGAEGCGRVGIVEPIGLRGSEGEGESRCSVDSDCRGDGFRGSDGWEFAALGKGVPSRLRYCGKSFTGGISFHSVWRCGLSSTLAPGVAVYHFCLLVFLRRRCRLTRSESWWLSRKTWAQRKRGARRWGGRGGGRRL